MSDNSNLHRYQGNTKITINYGDITVLNIYPCIYFKLSVVPGDNKCVFNVCDVSGD